MEPAAQGKISEEPKSRVFGGNFLHALPGITIEESSGVDLRTPRTPGFDLALRFQSELAISAESGSTLTSDPYPLNCCRLIEDDIDDDEDSYGDDGGSADTPVSNESNRDSVGSQSTCASDTTNESETTNSSSTPVASSSTALAVQQSGQNEQNENAPLPPNGQDEGNPRKRKHERESSQETLGLNYWPCPFYHHDKAKYVDSVGDHSYKSCHKLKAKELHRVKEHIYKAHKAPLHCQRCLRLFELHRDLHKHMNDRTCISRTTFAYKGIDHDQYLALKDKSQTTWAEICRILQLDKSNGIEQLESSSFMLSSNFETMDSSQQTFQQLPQERVNFNGPSQDWQNYTYDHGSNALTFNYPPFIPSASPRYVISPQERWIQGSGQYPINPPRQQLPDNNTAQVSTANADQNSSNVQRGSVQDYETDIALAEYGVEYEFYATTGLSLENDEGNRQTNGATTTDLPKVTAPTSQDSLVPEFSSEDDQLTKDAFLLSSIILLVKANRMDKRLRPLFTQEDEDSVRGFLQAFVEKDTRTKLKDSTRAEIIKLLHSTAEDRAEAFRKMIITWRNGPNGGIQETETTIGP